MGCPTSRQLTLADRNPSLHIFMSVALHTQDRLDTELLLTPIPCIVSSSLEYLSGLPLAVFQSLSKRQPVLTAYPACTLNLDLG